MNSEIRKLLGGYATGTLTTEERDELFRASLDDPTLFEALADEQVLRDLLDDSGARAELLQSIEHRRFSIADSLRDWFERPKAKVLTAVGLALVVAVAVTQLRDYPLQVPERHVTFSQAVRDELRAEYHAPPAVEPAPAPKKTETAKPKPRGVQQAESATFASAPPAPPPPPAEAQAPEVIRCTLLRRNVQGTYEDVANDYEFGSEDRVRLRIESQERGALLVKSGADTLYAGTISAGGSIITRQDILFSGNELKPVEVTLSPLPDSPTAAMVGVPPQGDAEVVTRMQPAAPGAPLVRTPTMQSAAKSRPPSPGTSTITLQIHLRRK